MTQTYAQLFIHLIFSTKNRVALIDEHISSGLHRCLARLIEEMGGRVYKINSVADHVHLLVSLPPKRAISDVVRHIKCNSSSWIKSTSQRAFAWQAGFGAFSVNQSQINILNVSKSITVGSAIKSNLLHSCVLIILNMTSVGSGNNSII